MGKVICNQPPTPHHTVFYTHSVPHSPYHTILCTHHITLFYTPHITHYFTHTPEHTCTLYHSFKNSHSSHSHCTTLTHHNFTHAHRTPHFTHASVFHMHTPISDYFTHSTCTTLTPHPILGMHTAPPPQTLFYTLTLYRMHTIPHTHHITRSHHTTHYFTHPHSTHYFTHSPCTAPPISHTLFYIHPP